MGIFVCGVRTCICMWCTYIIKLLSIFDIFFLCVRMSLRHSSMICVECYSAEFVFLWCSNGMRWKPWQLRALPLFPMFLPSSVLHWLGFPCVKCERIVFVINTNLHHMTVQTRYLFSIYTNFENFTLNIVFYEVSVLTNNASL